MVKIEKCLSLKREISEQKSNSNDDNNIKVSLHINDSG